MTPDHYRILGVEPSANAGDIRAAYLKLLREHHPDRNPSPTAAERTRSIIAAFRVLGDFDRRNRYDWDRRRDREAAEAVAAPRPANRTALLAGAMAIFALGGLLLKPDRAPESQAVRRDTAAARIPASAKAQTVSSAASRPAVDLVTGIESVPLKPAIDRKPVQRRLTNKRKTLAQER